MRNRMIKKEFWHSHRVLSISPNERLMFICMFNVADDEGILKRSELTMKSICFSCDSAITLGMIQEYIKNLLRVGLLVENEDGTLLKIKKWKTHQRIDRPTPSNYKFKRRIAEDSKNTPRVVVEDSTPKERKGIEKKGKEIKVKESKVKEDVQNKEFELFYSIYPRKQDKKRALKAFNNLTKNNQKLCIEGVKVYVKWLKLNDIQDNTLIKLPTTYINGCNWEDQLDLTPRKKTEKLEYKLDSTGRAAIGYCSKCNSSDFYDPYKINSLDSNCCNSKLLPEKSVNNIEPTSGFVSIDRSITDIMEKYK